METLSILRVLFAWQKVRKPRVGDHLLYDNITGLAGDCHWVVLGSAVLSFGDQGPTFAQPSRSDFSVYGRWILIVHHCSSCKTPGSLLSKISVEWPVMVSCNSLPVNMVAPRSYDVLLFFFFFKYSAEPKCLFENCRKRHQHPFAFWCLCWCTVILLTFKWFCSYFHRFVSVANHCPHGGQP